MIQENKTIDGRTKRAADIGLAKRLISRSSYDAVLAGKLSLAAAKDLGRDGGPDTPAGAAAVQDDPAMAVPETGVGQASCLCGCGQPVSRRFKSGHDVKMFRVAREHLTEGRELNEEQAKYLETSGKMARVKRRVTEEDRRRAER